jgi:Na+/melibiose symporter-like transporter
MSIRFPPPKQRAERFTLARALGLLRDPIFLFAGLALAIQSGMEGMSNDWMTRYFKQVTLAGQQSVEWKTQLGLIAVTGAMVVARLALAGLLKRVSSRLVLLASVAVTAAGATILMNANSYGLSLLAALLIGAGLAVPWCLATSAIGIPSNRARPLARSSSWR